MHIGTAWSGRARGIAANPSCDGVWNFESMMAAMGSPFSVTRPGRFLGSLFSTLGMRNMRPSKQAGKRAKHELFRVC